MRVSTVLALASSALAAPAVVTVDEVVYVTAGPQAPASSAVAAPALGNVVEVVVSKLVRISGDSTETLLTTYTKGVATATSSAAQTQTLAAVEQSVTTTDSKPTTTLTPTTSYEPSTTYAPTTTSSLTTTSSPTSTTPTTSSTPTTTSTSATSATATADSSFASAILDEHNKKRALHGVPDLTWSSTLEDYAQAYADAYDCSGTLTHSGGQYGENLGLGYTTTGVVDAWYDEISYYDWSNPAGSHFTQVVWKDTTQLGCGYKSCGSYYGQYTICSYNPAGNYAGEYSSNVLPLV